MIVKNKILGNIFVAAVLLFLLAGCNSVDKGNVRIKGTLENQGSEPLYLIYQDAIGNRAYQDTLIPVLKDEFDYTGKLKFGPGIYLLAKANPKEQPLIMFLEDATVYKIDGKSSAITSADVKGGEGAKLFQHYMEDIKPEIVNKKNTIDKFYQDRLLDEDTLALLAMDSMSKAVAEDELKTQEKFIIENKSNWFALHLFTESFVVMNGDYNRCIALFNKLDEKLKMSDRGQYVLQAINALKNTTKGNIIQEFQLPGADGTPQYFSDNFKSNKYTLIDFWASWCKPCRIQHPFIHNLYSQYHPKGFDIVSFSLDTEIEAWDKAKKDDGLVWKQYCDKRAWRSGVCQLLNIKILPTRYLVDNTGLIILKNPTPNELENFLKDNLK